MPDPFTTFNATAAFLKTDVLPVTPAALRSELRAAIKNIESAARELETLHPRSERECRELAALCKGFAEVLGDPPPMVAIFAQKLDRRCSSTPNLLGLRAEIQALLSAQMREARSRSAAASASERERLDAMLHGCYDTLGRHAAAASAWQDVFTPVAHRDEP